MNPVVFAGPSLRGTDAALARGVTFRPPAACGDLARVVLDAAPGEMPRVIGLIDGLFETTASPWHKEILWVMRQGVCVFGAASMGAIRAAELVPFGMTGIGAVFAAYCSGEIEADDEVAVQHGPLEAGYPVLTEALVNIRATLALARDEAVIDVGTHDAIIAQARALHFKKRSWPRLLGAAPDLCNWVTANAIDVKAADARLLVQAVVECDWQPSVPPPVENTVFLEALLRRIRSHREGTGGTGS